MSYKFLFLFEKDEDILLDSQKQRANVENGNGFFEIKPRKTTGQGELSARCWRERNHSTDRL